MVVGRRNASVDVYTLAPQDSSGEAGEVTVRSMKLARDSGAVYAVCGLASPDASLVLWYVARVCARIIFQWVV